MPRKTAVRQLFLALLFNCSVAYAANTPQEVGYWCGYRIDPQSTITLDMLASKPFVGQARLAFVGPAADSSVDISFLCSIHSAEKIKEWIKTLRAAGKQVTISFMDSAHTPWQDVDIKLFAKNLSTLVQEWDLTGVDIDAESTCENFTKTMISLVKECRAALPADKTITYTCYTCSNNDIQILTEVKDLLTTVTTMDYSDNFQSMVETAKFYALLVGESKVSVGVKTGVTPLSQVAQLGPWVRAQGYQGVMVWSFDCDSHVYRTQKDWAWTDAVHDSLQPGLLENLWSIGSWLWRW
jgi:chitinase